MKHAYKTVACKLVALAGVALTLNGCGTLFGQQGYFRDKSGDYVDEKVAPDLVIPGNLKAVKPVDYMSIPEVTASADVSRDDEVPRADRRIVHDDGSAYQIVTDGNKRVMLAQRGPAEVWTHILRFWEANNISVVAKDPSSGVMETDWVQIGDASQPGLMRRMVGRVIDLENSENSIEKFRLSVRQGILPETSEVILEHARRPVGADVTTPVDWNSENTASGSLQNGLMNEMLVYLVQNRDEQSVSLQARNLDVGDQTSLVRDGNGNPVLKIDQGFARSWQAVEVALNKAGVRVLDRNRSAGLIFISLSEGNSEARDGEESGWFGGLFGGDDEKPVAAESEYRLRVQSLGNATNVTLEKDLNTLPPADMSEAFLERLRSNLS
ncbi:outer membrane protein assembly factor BamC [Parendozoicomonas haliclonae]|uniref:Outer membrane protein assembly factor BamC n=1 Tax=Parendozoicomonas haliclonae TaxID=1960125 RepID=A0A1X7APQ4_9GAMM|nr:outer membrane protein assembly factor BamC [Parendozoicomonas haliclonae]SMA50078.1 Outer membrane protein assembly factor BamC precursor [Parendozoicomonas haliclonae]